MSTPHPRIRVFVLGDFQTNCHVVTPSEAARGQPCWIVDAGQEPDELIDWIVDNQLEPQAVILTHAHLDHIAGVDQCLTRFGRLPIHIHEAEAGFCSNPTLNLSALIGMDTTCAEPDQLLREGQELALGATRWRVLHTPGHSPGGACLIHDGSRQAIVGDTLFAGSIGRHDFPTSDPHALAKSLARLMTLDDRTVIYPGHGPMTTIGDERRTNPYLHGEL